MSAVSDLADPATRPAEIRGLVDNATDTALHGWAWNAARAEERLAIELRLGEAVVAGTVAERPRRDLGKAGIGDGAHAFELPLTAEWRRRHAELSVVARAADGTEAVLALRIRRTDVDPSGTVQRVLEAAATAHRQLREEVQRLGQRLPETAPDPAAQDGAIRALAEGQAALAEKLETLTVWLVRMDERLAALPAAVPAPPPRRRMDGWQLVLCGALVAVVLAAACGTALLAQGGGG